jgi:arylsulfatase A-like enzyme
MHVHLPLYVEDTFHGSSRNGPYGAAVHAIDWATGVLLDELDALGLADDTIVIFTSDNGALARPGEGSNAPLRGTKGRTTEGGMRVPAIIRWPGVVPAGVAHGELTTAMDLLPTLARWAGTSVPDGVVIDGHDITDVVINGATSPYETFAYFNGTSLDSVRDHRYKLRLLRRHGGQREDITELYDLVDDIGETTDISSEHPDVVARLRAAADRFRSELGDGHTGEPGTDRRPQGVVDEATTLCLLDDDNPMVIAEYDLPDRG